MPIQKAEAECKPNIAYGPNYDQILVTIKNDSNIDFNGSYEDPYCFYQFVIQPLDKNYKKYMAFYDSKQFIDSVEKYFKSKYSCDWLIMSRETKASKIHINVLMMSTITYIDLIQPLPYTKAVNNKWGVWGKKVSRYLADRDRLLSYIFKEAQYRHFHKYLDFIITIKCVKPVYCVGDGREMNFPSVTASVHLDDEDEPIDLNTLPQILRRSIF